MKRWLAALFLLTLTACAPPITERVVMPTTPEVWRTTTPTGGIVISETWWTLFNSPQLDEAVTSALLNNPDTAVAMARVNAARAQATAAGAALLPLVTVGSGAGLSQNSSKITQNGVRPRRATSKDYRMAIDASYELDIWGRLQGLRDAALAEALAEELGAANVRLQVATGVAESYFTLAYYDDEIRILQETAALREQALAIAEKRFTAGISSDVDARRADVEAANVAADIANTQRARAQEDIRLQLLTGAVASGAALPPQTLPTIVPVVQANLPSEVLQRRPDVQAALARLQAARATVKSQRADYYPRLSLTTNAGLASGALSDLISAPARFWGFGLDLIYPLFDAGRTRVLLEAAAAERDVVLADYRRAILQAFADVEDALVTLRFNDDSLSATTRAFNAAQQVRDRVRNLYDAGLINYLDVIDAERTLLATQRALNRARWERFMVTLGLIKALGGGWTKGETTYD